MRIVGQQIIKETEFSCDCSANTKLNLVRIKAEMSYSNETLKYEEFQCPVCGKKYHARYTLDQDLKMVCYPVAFHVS